MIIATIIMLATFLSTTVMTVGQLNMASKNEDIKRAVRTISSKLNAIIGKDRAKLNKLLSLATSNNQAALMQYMQQNPVLAKTLDELKADSSLIASIQSEQSSLEAEIADIQNNLNSLGYNSDIFSPTKETKQFMDIAQKYKDKSEEYSKLADKANDSNFSSARTITPNTSDLDARTQNINGGINNNGVQ